MLGWSAQTTVIAMVLAAITLLASRSARLGPAARHVLWLVVLIKLLTPPVLNWPWSPSSLSLPTLSSAPNSRTPLSSWTAAGRAAIAHPVADRDETIALEDRVAKPENVPARPTVAIPAPIIRPSFDRLNLDMLGQVLFRLWLGISAAIAVWRIAAVVRFHRRLSWMVPAPEWLEQEVRELSVQLGVRAPEILLLPDLAPPMLWLLGRAKLLLPGRLVANADRLGLRAILAHELAHLRRGDHWVRRLDFFAGLIWWWNPVYWLTRARLSTEAELACDEWAIATVPDGRVCYAEALLHICRTLSTTASPAPALGVTGAGRFLERRVKMILQNHAPSRIPVPVLLGAGLLLLLALPGWSAASSAPTQSSDSALSKSTLAKSVLTKSAQSTSKSDAKLLASATDEDDDVAAKDDKDDEDSDNEKDAAAIKAQIAKELKKELGPGSDFEKEMKNLGEELKRELGPGSDFEKSMKNLGGVLQKELGPGSDFQKSMMNLGDQLQKQLGPGSEFERSMNRLGQDLGKKFGEGSEFAEKLKQATKEEKAANNASDASSEHKAKKKTKAHKNTSTSKARAVKELRAQIEELNARLKKLEEADQDEND